MSGVGKVEQWRNNKKNCAHHQEMDIKSREIKRSNRLSWKVETVDSVRFHEGHDFGDPVGRYTYVTVSWPDIWWVECKCLPELPCLSESTRLPLVNTCPRLSLFRQIVRRSAPFKGDVICFVCCFSFSFFKNLFSLCTYTPACSSAAPN